MTETLLEMLSYPFMVRAFVVGILVALCSALLGVSLVLKRYSMIGDGLSHVGFGAMAVAAAANAAPLAVAIPVVIVAAVLLLRISGSSPDQRRRGHCPDLHQLSGDRRDGDFHDDGNEYRCVQLYVRKYSGNEPGGCCPERDSGGGGTGSLYFLLPENICHYL